MTLTEADKIALLSALIAAIALVMSIYAAHVTQRVATSGFQSAEKVKSDTASLLAALRGIMVKAILYSQQDPTTRDDESRPGHIKILPEQMAIQAFLSSPTAIAYYAFVAKRSKTTKESGQSSEPWRGFFFMIVSLLQQTNTYAAGRQAGQIEKMFDTVTDRELREISADLEDLAGSIRRLLDHRSYDTMLHVLVDMQKDDDDANFPAFVAFLRASGINDPEVDLWWVVTNGSDDDVDIVQDALRRGADPRVSSSTIISRYKELWSTFQSLDPGL